MTDKRKLVETLLLEKLAVDEQVKLLNDLANDIFSMINLKGSSEWTSDELQDLDRRQLNLKNIFISLEESFTKHYANEENFLREYLEPNRLEAVTKEVTAMMEQFNQVKALFNSMDIKGINREESMVRSLAIKRSIENFNLQVEAHDQKAGSAPKLLMSLIGTGMKEIK
jgi:hypothetical protein